MTQAVSVIGLATAAFLGIAVGSGQLVRALVLILVICVATASMRWPIGGLCLAVAAIPLEVAGRLVPGVEEITLAKALLLVAAGAWALRMMLARESIQLPRNTWALLGFWTAAVLGVVLGPYGMTLEAGASVVALTGQLTVVVMMYNLVRSQRDLHLVLAAVLVGCILVSSAGVLDIITGTSFLGTVSHQYLVDRVSGFHRITSTFYDPNALGGFLSFGIIINLTVLTAIRLRHQWQRPLLWVLLTVQAVCLVYTFSRGAFVAALGGVIAFVVMGKGSWRARLGGVTVAAVPGLLMFTPQIGALFGRFAAVDAGLGGRAVAFRAAMTAFLKHPVLGYGPGNAPRALGAIIGQTYATHNLYTEILVSVGAVGALFFGVFVVSLMRDAGRAKDARLVSLARGTTAALVGVLLMGLSLQMLKANELWLTLSLLACIVRLSLEHQNAPTRQEYSARASASGSADGAPETRAVRPRPGAADPGGQW